MRISDWSSDVCSSDLTNAQALHDRLAALGAAMIGEALAGLAGGDLVATPQPAEGITYAAKLDKAEGRLDWRDSAEALDRRIRAFTPWPGAYFEIAGEKGRERVQVLAATPMAAEGKPGTVLDDARSEEHTSELQSLMRRSYAVFCLKKKKRHIT